jgi:TetR/AcrR family transcriptional regulator
VTAVAALPPKGRIRQAQEAVILRAAERVFARRGFSGATVADIAAEAALPKSTVHYYFGTKEALHRAVLDDILALWLEGTEAIRPEAEPHEALAAYVRHKMQLSAERPDASRVFANELLHGAPQIDDALRGGLRALVHEKAAVVDAWIAAGRMAPVDSTHLFFTVWAMTQTYADFAPQVAAVLGCHTPLPAAEQRRASTHVERFVLRACGLSAPDSPPHDLQGPIR